MQDADFNTLHEKLRPKVLSFLQRLVSVEEAEDAAQEVFLKVHQGLPGFHNQSKVSTWVFQIATNTALDRLRSPSHRNAARLQPLAEVEPQSHEECHDHLPMQAEMQCCIRGMVNDLQLDYRSIIHLCELRELTMGQISEVLGISPGAAKIRLHRARKALKARLEQGCTISLDHRAELICDRRLPTGE